MKMGLKIELVLGLFCLLVNSEIHCLRWSSGPDQQVVLRACAGTTLSLPWGAIVNQGESIDTVRWFYSGRSDEMIATYTFGNVFATPTYCGRAHKTTNAGIDIDHVTALESGNYSVEVVVRDSHGGLLTLSTFVIVSIEDGLQTTDGQLHVVQDPVAEYSNQTGQYHVALRCGTFNYSSNPPFNATWQTPSNQTLPSSSYQAGSFQLLLPNPVEGGSYVCRVPPAPACLHGNSSGEATVTMDKVEARFAVLEARQAHLEMENNRLQNMLSKRVSFHAQGNDDFQTSSGCVVIFPHVVTNDGNGYDATSGRFRAPFSGTYCFVASTSTSDSGDLVRWKLMMDSRSTPLDWLAIAPVVHSTYNYGMGSVNAVVHMNAGQHVWIESYKGKSKVWGEATTFSGFLVSADL